MVYCFRPFTKFKLTSHRTENQCLGPQFTDVHSCSLQVSVKDAFLSFLNIKVKKINVMKLNIGTVISELSGKTLTRVLILNSLI